MIRRLILVLSLAALFVSWTYAAKQCSNASLHGTYGFHAIAFTVPPSGGPATPRAVIGLFTLDGAGNFTTSLTINDNGVITHPAANASLGTYQINPDCTGTLSIAVGGTVEIVVVDKGREFYQMRTDPASVVLFSTTKKISAGAGTD